MVAGALSSTVPSMDELIAKRADEAAVEAHAPSVHAAMQSTAALDRRSIEVPKIRRRPTSAPRRSTKTGLIALQGVAPGRSRTRSARGVAQEGRNGVPSRSAAVPAADVDTLKDSLLRAKHESQALREENQALRVSAARSEKEARAAERERDEALAARALESATDARLTHRLTESALIGRLRERAKELSAQLAEKERELHSLRAGSKHARAVQLDVERRAYLAETQRLRQLLEEGATDLEAHKKLWRREFEEDLRRRLAENRALQQRIEQMKQREAALDEELGVWISDNDRLKSALDELRAQAGAGSAKEAARALGKEVAREKQRAARAEAAAAEQESALHARIAQLEGALAKAEERARAAVERSARLDAERRAALKELATAQASALQLQRTSGGGGAGAVAAPPARATSAVRIVDAYEQHELAARKVQAAAKRKQELTEPPLRSAVPATDAGQGAGAVRAAAVPGRAAPPAAPPPAAATADPTAVGGNCANA